MYWQEEIIMEINDFPYSFVLLKKQYFNILAIVMFCFTLIHTFKYLKYFSYFYVGKLQYFTVFFI